MEKRKPIDRNSLIAGENPSLQLGSYRFNLEKIEEANIFTEITHLLVYPQKVAAAKLGINKTALRKKFKEATNRKWPYRSLAKIETELQTTTSKDEIKKLLEKKKQLLSPVYIMLNTKKTMI